MSLEVGFGVSKPHAIPNSLSLLPAYSLACELSACYFSHRAYHLACHFPTMLNSCPSGTVSPNKVSS